MAYLMDELIPFVEARYKVAPGRSWGSLGASNGGKHCFLSTVPVKRSPGGQPSGCIVTLIPAAAAWNDTAAPASAFGGVQVKSDKS